MTSTTPILITDDDASFRLILRRFLENNGYPVIEAANGNEAISLASENDLSIIMIDGDMPEKNGFETCWEIKSNPKNINIPVIMITGLVDDEFVDKAFEAGAAEYITKPVHWALLKQRIKHLIHNNATESTLREAKNTAEIENKTKSEFLRRVSHELRTPLHAILSFARIGHGKAEGQQQEYFSVIIESGQRLQRHLDDLLDLSRLETNKMDFHIAENNLKTAVNIAVDKIKETAQKSKSTITIKDESSINNGLFDPKRIIQITEEIIRNAINHTPDGCNIEIIIVNETVDNENGSWDAVSVSVKDTGKGIPDCDLYGIFNIFSKSEENENSGTGMGLSIAKKIIEAHKGRIFAENNSDGGATVTYSIPAGKN